MHDVRVNLMSLMRIISDSGNPIVSKFITYLGVGGIGGSSAQVFANSQLVKDSQHMTELVNACVSASPSWLVYVPAVGVASLLLKNISDFIFRRIEHKKIMNEKQTDTDNLC